MHTRTTRANYKKPVGREGIKKLVYAILKIKLRYRAIALLKSE
jgi:hypothetical protein